MAATIAAQAAGCDDQFVDDLSRAHLKAGNFRRDAEEQEGVA